MAFKIEVICYKCDKEFEVRNDCLPMQEEIGYINKAECPHCGADCGKIAVMLTVD